MSVQLWHNVNLPVRVTWSAAEDAQIRPDWRQVMIPGQPAYPKYWGDTDIFPLLLYNPSESLGLGSAWRKFLDVDVSFDFTAGVLPEAMTFTRASTGTYNSSGGILSVAAINQPRFNYVGGVSNLLIEPAATNLLPHSNNFSDAVWNKGATPVLTPAQFVSPDGTNNGWSMTSGTGNAHVFQAYTYTAVPYVISIWVKQIVGSAQESLVIASFGSPQTISTTITRLTFSRTPAGGIDSALFQVTAVAGSTNGIFGAQLETGSVATSYIPTTTAAATRAADSASFTIPVGVGHLIYTFDDNSTQTVTVSPGSYTIPTNLNRLNIKYINSTT